MGVLKNQKAPPRPISKTITANDSNRDVTERRTRHSDHLHLSRFRTNIGKRTFRHRACVLYNEHVIGTELQELSYARFKKVLKTRLVSS